MKINKVKLRNINSLQTSEVIELNFMESPLADTGLFAIVGDTGAGKTTILDAITLAIYGKVHRNKNEKEVISYGATDSLAEVEFEANEQIFRSKWNIWRARNQADGNIQPARRELSQWNSEKQQFDIIYERIHGYNEKVQEISGLDYGQFCRSVLLAQGDFAAFLKAESKERSELLERITGTDYYTKISQAAYERHDLEAQKLHQLQERLASLDILPEEVLQELQNHLQHKSKETNALHRQIQDIQSQVQWLKICQQLQERKEVLEKDKIKTEQELANKKDDFERLEQHIIALPFKADLDNLNKLATQRDELKNKIEQGAQHLSEITLSKEKQEEALQMFQSTFDELKNGREEQEQIFRSTEKLDFQIATDQETWKKIREEHLLQQSKQQKEEEQKSFAEKGELVLKREIEALEKSLEKRVHLKNTEKDLAQLELHQERICSLRNSIQDLEQKQLRFERILPAQEKKLKLEDQKAKNANDLLEEWERKLLQYAPRYYKKEFKSRSGWLQKSNEQFQVMKLYFAKLQTLSNILSQKEDHHLQLVEHQEALQTLEQQLEGSEKRLAELKIEVRNRKRHYELEYSFKNYERDRSNLKMGEPCPVCRSTEHPFREMEWKEKYIDEAKKSLEKSEMAFEKEQTYSNNIGQQQKNIEGKIELLEQESERLKQQIPSIQAEITDLHMSQQKPDLSYKGIQKGIKNYEQHLAGEEKRQSAVAEIDAAMNLQENKKAEAQENLLKWRAEMQEITAQFKVQQQQLKNWKIELQNIIQTTNDLLEKYPSLKLQDLEKKITQLRQLQQRFGQDQDALQEKSNSLKELEQQIKYFTQQLKERSLMLKQRAENLARLQLILQEFQQKRRDLLEDKNPAIERKKLLQKIEESEKKLQETQANFNHLQQQLIEKKATLQSQENQLEDIKKVGIVLQQRLKKALDQIGLSLKKAEQNLLPESEVIRLESMKKNLENQLQKTELSLKEISQQLQKEHQKKKTTELPEILKINQLEKQQAYEKLQQEVGALKERIHYNYTKKMQSKSLQKELEIQKKEYARWKKLNDLIGMRSGKKFRVFAQGLTLQQLVYHANQHLQKLNDRYFVQKREDEELELEIVDRYQANHLRSMNTLSGGESFLVSLALALGLSDLAGRNTLIRSLFIDEGFGTLDEATLDMAITTLENLQADGKTIGIISHVTALKERISTQIRVNKRGSGYSVVEVVG